MSTLDAKTSSPQWARVLASGLFGLYLLIAAATLWLIPLGGAGGGESAVVMGVIGFAGVGALVARRQPRNSVGWLMLAVAISFAGQTLIESYITVTDRPAYIALAWIGSWFWRVWLTLALVLPLVFPDGKLLSKRWRPALWICIASLLLWAISKGLQPEPLNDESGAYDPNPFGVRGPALTLINALGLLGYLLLALGLPLSVACLAQRLRRARGLERVQVQSFAYVAALALSLLGVSFLAGLVISTGTTDSRPIVLTLFKVGWLVGALLFLAGLPLVIGTSILRHRLYDIDLVIKRTLVYGALSLLLALTYLGLVLSLRSLLNPLTGESDLAVAASTLAVAALFRPLRTRIQSLVDRRFYRARYDASQAIVAFTAQLRQEVDLDTVTTDLLGVVRETLQPDQATLWLRKPT